MKKLALTIAVVLGLGMSCFADGNQGGGLFQRGTEAEENNYYGDRGGSLTPGMPGHGGEQNEDAPLGTGIFLLTALGAGYLVAKKRGGDR